MKKKNFDPRQRLEPLTYRPNKSILNDGKTKSNSFEPKEMKYKSSLRFNAFSAFTKFLCKNSQ